MCFLEGFGIHKAQSVIIYETNGVRNTVTNSLGNYDMARSLLLRHFLLFWRDTKVLRQES